MEPCKIYVISLSNQLKRRRFITKQLDSLQLDYTIFDAIDGNALSQEEYNALVDTETVESKKWLTKGAIGCALSHVEVCKLIARGDAPFALVLEDDCILSEELPKLLDSVSDVIAQSDVILFYFSSGRPIQLKLAVNKELHGKYHVYDAVAPNKLASTVAYVISKEASERFVNSVVPIKTSADSWGDFLDNEIIRNIRCVYPMPVDTADFKSSIDYLAIDSLIGKLSAFIDKYRLFPIYQILKRRRRRVQEKRKVIEVIQ